MGFLNSLFGFAKNIIPSIVGAGKSVFGGAQQLGNQLGGAMGGFGNLAKTATSALGPGVANLFGSGSQGQSQPSLSLPSRSGNTMPFSPQASPASSLIPSTAGFQNTDQNPKKKTFFDNMFPGGGGNALIGAALPAIGQMFGPKSPQIPDINSLQSVQALQNFRPGQSVSPEYQKMLQNQTGRLRDERLKQLQRVYKTARPGTDYTTDTNYQRDLAEIERGIQEQSADDLARAEGQFSSQEQNRLSEIAQMDIYSIMAQTGLDAQEAQQFQEMFGQAGGLFTKKALWPDMFSTGGQ